MRFEVEQTYDAELEEVWELYATATIYPHLVGLHRVDTPSVLSRETAGDATVVRVRYRFIADLPAAARRVIGAGAITWVEETSYDAAARTATAVLRPDDHADRITAAATATFVRADQGTVRRVVGEVRVRVPVVGGRVEGAIVSGLEEYLDEERRIGASLLAAPSS